MVVKFSYATVTYGTMLRPHWTPYDTRATEKRHVEWLCFRQLQNRLNQKKKKFYCWKGDSNYNWWLVHIHGNGYGFGSLSLGISLWLQLFDVESSHWTKTGTDILPYLATVPFSGTGPRPWERSPCMWMSHITITMPWFGHPFKINRSILTFTFSPRLVSIIPGSVFHAL